jgi:hypothetical protein
MKSKPKTAIPHCGSNNDSSKASGPAAPPVAALNPVQAAATKVDVEQLRDRISQLVLKSPDKAAKILADWLNKNSQPGSSSSTTSTASSGSSSGRLKKAG